MYSVSNFGRGSLDPMRAEGLLVAPRCPRFAAWPAEHHSVLDLLGAFPPHLFSQLSILSLKVQSGAEHETSVDQ